MRFNYWPAYDPGDKDSWEIEARTEASAARKAARELDKNSEWDCDSEVMIVYIRRVGKKVREATRWIIRRRIREPLFSARPMPTPKRKEAR